MERRGVVAIVGCGLGLGGAIAVKFAKEGYSVAAMARTQASLDAVEQMLGGTEHKHAYYAMDATKKEDVDVTFEKVVADLGHSPTVLVYNISEDPISLQQTVLDIDPRDFVSSFNVNALGALLCTQAALPPMLASDGVVVSATSKGVRKKGTILYTSATSASRATAKSARYAAGKMALRALSQSVAKEYGKQGVHAVHIRMDCTYESPRNQAVFTSMGMGGHYDAASGANQLASIADLADTYFALHMQSPMAWSNEVDLRPFTEDWSC